MTGRLNLLYRGAEIIERYSWLIVLAALVISGFAGFHVAENLAINTSTTDMIDSQTPFRQHDTAFKQAFPQFSDLIVVVIDGNSAEMTDQTATELATAIAARSDLFDWAKYPNGDPFFRQNGLLYLDEGELSALTDRLAQAAPFLTSLSQAPNLVGLFDMLGLIIRDGGDQVAQFDGFLGQIAANTEKAVQGKPGYFPWRALIEDGDQSLSRQIVLARPRLDFGGLSPASDAIAAIRNLAETKGFAPDNGIQVRLTGGAVLDQEELQSVELGGKTAGILSLVLVCILLALGLRSVRLILASLLTLCVGLIWTAFFATVVIGHLNLISVAFAVLFIGLAVDFSLHLCLRYREALTKGAARAAAITDAVNGCGLSLAVSAVCAAAGFLAFLPTDYRGLAELGLISGAAMFIALLANLTLLPALLHLLGGGTRWTTAGLASKSLPGAAVRPVLFGACLVGLVAAIFAAGVRFDFNPLNLKPTTSESVSTFLALAEDPQTSAYNIDIVMPTLAEAAAEAARLRKLPFVGSAITLEDLVPAEQDDKLAIIEDTSFFLAPILGSRSPSGEPSASAMRDAVQSLRESLKTSETPTDLPGLNRLTAAIGKIDATDSDALRRLSVRLTRFLPPLLDQLRTSLSAVPYDQAGIPGTIRRDWLAPDGQARVRVSPAQPVRTNDELRIFAKAMLAAQPTATGTPVIISEAGEIVVRSFQQATVIAAAAIVFILVVTLRQWRRVLLVLAPLLLSAVLTLATAAIFDLPFNFANVIVLPLLLGLGVASGIHLVIRHRNDAAALMVTSTPRAVLFSSLTTLASFGSLAISGHPGMNSMGQLLTISILYLLVSMLVVLPALLSWWDGKAQTS